MKVKAHFFDEFNTQQRGSATLTTKVNVAGYQLQMFTLTVDKRGVVGNGWWEET